MRRARYLADDDVPRSDRARVSDCVASRTRRRHVRPHGMAELLTEASGGNVPRKLDFRLTLKARQISDQSIGAEIR